MPGSGEHKLTADAVIEGSRRLGPLRVEQLQRALHRFDCGDFVSAQPIQHGLFGQNVFVTSTTGKFVLRGMPHWLSQFPHERFFCEQIKKQTRVPVPHPYRVDPSTDIFGWSYVLMPRMPGTFIHDPDVIKTLTLDDRIGIAAAMGETLAELHRCTFPECGEYDLHSDAIKPLDKSFADWTTFHLEKTLKNCEPLTDFCPPSDLLWARREIEAARPALEVPFQPCAVMHDFREGNSNHALIEGKWRVTGLYDLTEFFVGDGEMDLSRQLADYTTLDQRAAAAFVQTYLAHRPARPLFAQRFRVYMLADRLTIWDYGIHNGWFKKGTTMQEWIRPSLELANLI